MSWLLPPLEPTFEAAVRDAHAHAPEARAAAAARLGKPPAQRTAEARAGLRRLARDPELGVRRAAWSAIASLADPDSLVWVRGGLRDPDARVRELATLAVAEAGGTEALEILRECLESEHPEVRLQAVQGYALLGSERACEALAPLLRDVDPEVRGATAEALGCLWPWMTRNQPTRALRACLGDAVPSVRHRAALALAPQGVPEALGPLLEALQEPSVALKAAHALGELGRDEAGAALVRLTRASFKPAALRVAAAGALARLGDPRGVQALRRFLRAWGSQSRGCALQYVGELQLTELADELARLSRNPRGIDPEALVQALARLADGSDVARTALRHLAQRPDEAGIGARRALRNR